MSELKEPKAWATYSKDIVVDSGKYVAGKGPGKGLKSFWWVALIIVVIIAAILLWLGI